MSDDLEFRMTELERRLENVVRIGTIVTPDYAGATATVQIGGNVTAPRPWLTLRAGGDRSWWAPEAGEQVVLFSPSGDLAQAVILPAIYSTAAPAPASSADVSRQVFADGFIIEHDRAAKRTTLNAWDSEGTLELRAKNIVLKTGDDGYYHLDHAGYATRITHDGGANYTADKRLLAAIRQILEHNPGIPASGVREALQTAASGFDGPIPSKRTLQRIISDLRIAIQK